jgi:tellurite resistance protein TerC
MQRSRPMIRTFVQMDPTEILVLCFSVIVLVLMLFDIRALFKNDENSSNPKKALWWTLIWMGTAMVFSALVWCEKGYEKFTQFQSAYWIEQSLSVDNLFVFLMVFKFFKVDGKAQRKVLLWGILGAMVLRALFIFTGTWLIKLTYLPPFWKFTHSPYESHIEGYTQINLIIFIFGILLLYGGLKALFKKEKDENPDFNNFFGARFVRKNFKVLTNFNSHNFWIRRNGKLFFTKLFLVLFVIESTDLLFAIDSVPAIFSIAPNDPFILYSSNIFAIFGLRSLYFLLSNSLDKFSKLKYGIAFILAFIGLKMIIAPIYHFDTTFSLLAILGILIVSILISVKSIKST